MSRLLIVEDDDHRHTSLGSLFEAEGHEVDEGANGDIALEVARHMQASLTLVDVMLPAISGFETCGKLRELGDMPIVIVSARGTTPMSSPDSSREPMTTQPSHSIPTSFDLG